MIAIHPLAFDRHDRVRHCLPGCFLNACAWFITSQKRARCSGMSLLGNTHRPGDPALHPQTAIPIYAVLLTTPLPV